ncbi:alpha/beta hydrolase [archaeon]|nr:MAG: alpha/beta hydrolase [archaeon]
MKVYFSDLLPAIRPNDLLEVHVLTSKNFCKIPVFFIRHPQATETILYSHGNASDIGAMYVVYALISRALKINIVAYDYTGYGASKAFQKKPTEKQTYIDIETVYTWILEQKIVTDALKQLFVYGQSVGSGPSVFLAANHAVAGLILHSPILSGLRVITPSRSLACFDIFPNIDRISNVSCTVFILHGEEDMEVGLHHGKDLHQAGMMTEIVCSLYVCVVLYFQFAHIYTIHHQL